MLTSVTIKNLRNHADTRVEGLRPLNVIAGPDGSGKTSFLEAVHVIHRIGVASPPNLFPVGSLRAPELMARSGQRDYSIAAWGDEDGRAWHAEVSFQRVAERWSGVTLVALEGGPRTPASHGVAGILGVPDWFKTAVTDAKLLRLESSALRGASRPQQPGAGCAADGAGLANTVAWLARDHAVRFRQVVGLLREVVPEVVNVSTAPVPVSESVTRTARAGRSEADFEVRREAMAEELAFDTIDAERIPAAHQADGALFALGILASLILPSRPNLVLLDDVERGLDPPSQRRLIRVLRRVAATDATLQVIMTTHSPYIVDELAPEELWVAGRDATRQVRVMRMLELPDADGALRVLTTGEFWSVLGDYRPEGGE